MPNTINSLTHRYISNTTGFLVGNQRVDSCRTVEKTQTNVTNSGFDISFTKIYVYIITYDVYFSSQNTRLWSVKIFQAAAAPQLMGIFCLARFFSEKLFEVPNAFSKIFIKKKNDNTYEYLGLTFVDF